MKKLEGEKDLLVNSNNFCSKNFNKILILF
jgi:hypothetical protein